MLENFVSVLVPFSRTQKIRFTDTESKRLFCVENACADWPDKKALIRDCRKLRQSYWSFAWFLLVASKGTRRRQGIRGEVFRFWLTAYG